MKIITLEKIDSTNDFLKKMIRNTEVENFSIVIAHNQSKGRGQMENQWLSEPGKNLTFSILIKNFIKPTTPLFLLNCLISTVLIEFISEKKIKNTSIKWPNDIFIDNQKVAGILIENSYKSNTIVDSVIGIGLNVNQIHFPNLPLATSLALKAEKKFDTQNLLLELQKNIIKKVFDFKETNGFDLIKTYNQNLYKINKPMVFKKADNPLFMGMIKRVLINGKIVIMKDDDSEQEYTNKEIEFVIQQ